MSNSAWSGARPHIDESELLCKTGCGYYGNPAWNGHCSKCYKELGQKKNQKKGVFDPTEIKNKVSRSVNDVSEFPSRASSMMSRKLDKFEEKRQQLDKRTKAVKSIFKKTHSSQKEDKSHPKVIRQLSEESEAAVSELETFLNTTSKDAEQVFQKCLRNFVDKNCKSLEQMSLDELGDLVHDFYYTFNELMASNLAFSEFTQEQVEKVIELVEKYITTRFYKTFISEVNALSEEKDLIIQKRIRSLNWVSTSHLECKMNERNSESRLIIDQIISDLIEIDSKRVPSEKLRLLVSASNRILNLLSKSSGGTPASADDFLPALIFCVIRANPPLLQSNICYVTNFAQQSYLQSGEAGYFFTNLCCAVSFIEKLTADSLGLTQAEFDRYMIGDALPPNALDPSYMCDGLQLMQKSLESMCEMESHLNMLIDSYDSIVKDLEEFETGFVDEVEKVMEITLFNIRSKKANIDEPDPSQELLPPPLMPLNMESTEKKSSGICTPENMVDWTSATASSASDNTCIDRNPNVSSEAANSKDELMQRSRFSPFYLDELTASNVHFNQEGSGNSSSSLFQSSAGFDLYGSSDSSVSSYSGRSNLKLLEEEPLSLQDYTLEPIEGVFESKRTRNASPNPLSTYTGFSVQGVRIPNIPCDTGDSHCAPDPLSPPMGILSVSLPPPMLPTTGTSTNITNELKKDSKTDKMVGVLGDIIETFENLP